MTDAQQRAAAKNFAEQWQGKGYEKGQSQMFWTSLLVNVLGVPPEDMAEFIVFEEQVKLFDKLDTTNFIDAYIPSTHVLIEQKNLGKDLRAPIKQSDGTSLTPFQQAFKYASKLPYSKRPRWIVISNFAEFHLYDMERPGGAPEVIALANLEKDYTRLKFLVDSTSEHIQREMEISLQAGEIVGVLYDALLKHYTDADNPSADTLKSLNALCVRLVFCLYAEDAGIFSEHSFHDYLKHYEANARGALIDLFKVLNTKPEERSSYLNDDLLAFPYVNGGLFADENIEIPKLDAKIVDLILHRASEGFNWADISPTIFGAVFESTLNPVTRRSGGMHYTSIENIHKVINPLFLDDLKAELDTIRAVTVERTRRARLLAFQTKLAGLTFLDPACGSGNFLTETYLSLRRLENEIINELHGRQVFMEGEGFENPIKVSINQFYGIEINDFAVTVARTALWIAESQTLKETENIVHNSLDFLPLKSHANIIEGNALRLDWSSLVPSGLNYIMGNPPFVGASYQNDSQKSEILSVCVDKKGKPYKTAKKMDYVAGWYFKAAEFMVGSNSAIRAAFVSTNSVTQGEQVAGIWKPLYDRFGIHFDFAHRTFVWDSESNSKAHVHCVIVGFSTAPSDKPKVIYSGNKPQTVEQINAYLTDAPSVFIERRSKPLCGDVPAINVGNEPIDGGNYLFTTEERDAFLAKEPASAKYFYTWYGAYDFINNSPRCCLWLDRAEPNELHQLPECMKRVTAVKTFRLESKNPETVKKADTPRRFHFTNVPTGDYIVIPKVSSERRRYIPMGYMGNGVLCSDMLFIMPNATLYHLGVLTSNVHMSWVRAVCGRLKSDYRYSANVVYNNFPWPSPNDKQREKISATAQAILDARTAHPNATLADLYDETTMPPDLRKAHQANDRAVMAAYGFDTKMSESDCVTELMRMYQRLCDKV